MIINCHTSTVSVTFAIGNQPVAFSLSHPARPVMDLALSEETVSNLSEELFLMLRCVRESAATSEVRAAHKR